MTRRSGLAIRQGSYLTALRNQGAAVRLNRFCDNEPAPCALFGRCALCGYPEELS